MSSRSKSPKLRDRVDQMIADWRKERPDLAVGPIAIVGRLGRLMVYLEEALESVFAEHGISRATFDVLAALRRAGAPYKLSQTALLESLMRTSGTISLRIDRLEREGLVQRQPILSDRRSVSVCLTEKGLRLFDAVAPLHLENEARLLEALSVDEQSDLAELLRKLLLSFETPDEMETPVRLGLLVHSRADTIRLRRAVGLPERSGVLVRNVDKDGPAEQAGLRQGDLIVRVEGTEVRSWVQLKRALSRHQGSFVTLSVVRGARERKIRVPL
jgi:DNA-binding MarR family transcriptional regulator